jgi:hypothetical protein
MTGAEWLVVPGVALVALGWFLLDRANQGASKAERNSMFLALGGFLMAFTGLMVSVLGVRAFDNPNVCDDGEPVGAGGYCSDFDGG